jgi:hypothetical protein
MRYAQKSYDNVGANCGSRSESAMAPAFIGAVAMPGKICADQLRRSLLRPRRACD